MVVLALPFSLLLAFPLSFPLLASPQSFLLSSPLASPQPLVVPPILNDKNMFKTSNITQVLNEKNMNKNLKKSYVTCFASSPILVYEVSNHNSDFGKEMFKQTKDEECLYKYIDISDGV